jgi:probable HAF family extracellular repeat protein
MADLGTFGGNYSRADGVNDSGQVIGHSRTEDGYYHAFITGADGMGMTDLGTLGGVTSYAYGINDSGQVAGFSETADGSTHAFITGPNGMGMTDLNSFADLADGIFLSGASGVNNLGQVIATVSPIPEPTSYALMLAGLGLVGFTARQKKPAENNARKG